MCVCIEEAADQKHISANESKIKYMVNSKAYKTAEVSNGMRLMGQTMMESTSLKTWVWLLQKEIKLMRMSTIKFWYETSVSLYCITKGTKDKITLDKLLN